MQTTPVTFLPALAPARLVRNLNRRCNLLECRSRLRGRPPASDVQQQRGLRRTVSVRVRVENPCVNPVPCAAAAQRVQNCVRGPRGLDCLVQSPGAPPASGLQEELWEVLCRRDTTGVGAADCALEVPALPA